MDDERRWLQTRAEDVVDAPKFLGIFVAVAAFLLYLRPVGWHVSWLFFLIGFVPGVAAVTAISARSQVRFRAAATIRITGILVVGLIMWRLVAVSALGAMLWGFAYAIPPKLLLVISRRSLIESIDRVLHPHLFQDSRHG